MSGGTLTVERQRGPSWPGALIPAHPVHLGGVPIGVDLSFVFATLLSAWTFAAGFLPETDPNRTSVAYWTAGIVGALLLCASLLIHELGHALAARRKGLAVTRITLSFAGGASDIAGTIRQPADALLIALGGPLASLLGALVAAIAHVVIVETSGPGLPASVAAIVAVGNAALTVVNVLPGLPLDGGHALSAALWKLTGRSDLATRWARTVGDRLGDAAIAIAVIASAFGFLAIACWCALFGFAVRSER
jgi:Zn-dependent protease